MRTNNREKLLLILVGCSWAAATALAATEADGPVSVVMQEERRVELSVRPDDRTHSGNHKVEVFLPRGYASETNSFPVLYVFDGMSLRSEHDALVEEGLIQPAILVAIHNRPEPAGIFDLTTSRDRRLATPSRGLPAFAQLIVGRINPYVDGHFRTRPEAAHTGVVGISLGGLGRLLAGMPPTGDIRSRGVSSAIAVLE